MSVLLFPVFWNQIDVLEIEAIVVLVTWVHATILTSSCGYLLMQKMSVTEVQGDLFTSSDSLVHCVSRDLHMGKGIATEFKKQFGGVDELRRQSKLVFKS